MYERGIRFRLLETYFRQSAVMCLEKTGNTKDALGFNDVYSAFVVLVLGYCLSILILVVERIFPPAQFPFMSQDEGDNLFLSSRTMMENIGILTGFRGGKNGQEQLKENTAYKY